MKEEREGQGEDEVREDRTEEVRNKWMEVRSRVKRKE